MKSLGEPRKLFKKAIDMVVDGYIIDDENRQVLINLVDYFSDIPASEKPVLDARKGILIIGNPGAGKTLLLEVFNRLIRNLPTAYKIMTCIDATKNYENKGDGSIRFFGNYFFDDLGHEEIVNRYGNKREVLHDIIFDRYNLWRLQRVITHFTTNKSPLELIQRYGDHCYSRLQQMCNIVALGATASSIDRRTQSIPLPLVEINHYPKFYLTPEEEQEEKDLQNIIGMYQVIRETPVIPVNRGIGTVLKERMKEALPNAFKEQKTAGSIP